MRQSNEPVDHWPPFYIDERQTNFLLAHERVKIAELVSAI
jgi:hypothetical protein